MPQPTAPGAIPRLVEQLLAGDRAALARLISTVERGAHTAEIRRLIAPHLGQAFVVGITGPPGAGKSTLVDQLLPLLRADDRPVGVLAVDPTSPLSGGAFLGDRIRLQNATADPGVFVRSLASRGASGGLSAAAHDAARLLDAAGNSVIVVETVGVGQGETAISRCADCTVAVLVPEAGDAVQLFKAGLLEVADLLVVNKGDRPGAASLAAALRAQPVHQPVPVIATKAVTGWGVEKLARELEALRERLTTSGELQRRREARREVELHELLLARLRALLAAQLASPELRELVAAVRSGARDPHAAAQQVLARLLPRP